jgi:ribosomal protein S18 acetylase RimI-like enzyme
MGTTSPFTVRDARHADIAHFTRIMPAAGGLLSGAMWVDPAYVAAGIDNCAADLSAKQKLKVVSLGDEVVGCSFTGLGLLEEPPFTVFETVGAIHAIAVAPEHRRRGAGSALLAACEEDLHGNGATVLVVEVRPGAVALFAACGYRATGAAYNLAVIDPAGTYRMEPATPATTVMWKVAPGRKYTASKDATRPGTLMLTPAAP